MSSRAAYEIRISTSAEREMKHLPRSVHDRIVAAILALEADPRPRGCKRLRGSNAYRMRVGDYRVLYTVDDRARVVRLAAVGNRRDVYRNL
ncbi:MAG: type II toxin-antitoxin system RelE/ParE family toxin [Planctomycetes bacterium]|nr:type II toxin-antitoxin system RelE/ParE family toxin [Planctomycetota bacterium]